MYPGHARMPQVHRDFLTAHPNGITLLVIIKLMVHSFEEQRKMSDALTELKTSFYKLYQGKNMKLEYYHKLFQVQVDILEEVGITIEDESLVNSSAEENGQNI